MGFFTTDPPPWRKYDHLTPTHYLERLLNIEGSITDYSLDDLDHLDKRLRRHPEPKPSMRRSCWTLVHLVGEKRLADMVRACLGVTAPDDKAIHPYLSPLLFAASISTEPVQAFRLAQHTELVKRVKRKQKSTSQR